MDLLQNSLAGCSMSSSYVDATHATVNNAAGDQLISIANTTVNGEFIVLLPVYLVSNPSL
jgi:hypothetical protein